jgi:hypothetical protein
VVSLTEQKRVQVVHQKKKKRVLKERAHILIKNKIHTKWIVKEEKYNIKK